MFNSSSKPMWSLFNQYQLTMLLPFLRSYISDDLLYFLTQLNIVSFNSNFLNIGNWMGSVRDLIDYPQRDQTYSDNNYNSGGFLVNCFGSLMLLVLVVVTHITFILTYKLIKWEQKDSRFPILDLIYINFHFSFYFRVLLQIYVFSLLLATHEIIYITNFLNHMLSYCISLWWLCFLLFFNTFVVYFYMKHKQAISSHRMFKELY